LAGKSISPTDLVPTFKFVGFVIILSFTSESNPLTRVIGNFCFSLVTVNFVELTLNLFRTSLILLLKSE
ncbi:MAG: hypothetical protein ACKPKO_46365, partial [Candidatus Fonsibacter sp.]